MGQHIDSKLDELGEEAVGELAHKAITLQDWAKEEIEGIKKYRAYVDKYKGIMSTRLTEQKEYELMGELYVLDKILEVLNGNEATPEKG